MKQCLPYTPGRNIYSHPGLADYGVRLCGGGLGGMIIELNLRPASKLAGLSLWVASKLAAQR